MLPSAFDEETGVIGPPSGWTEEDCASLSVFQGKNESGEDVVISCWKPTKEEMTEIIKTGRIWLIIYGTTMPPVAPTGIKPFV